MMAFNEAKKEKLEVANQKLVKDILTLSMNFDNLARRSKRQKTRN
jgi:hypothetical protein